MKNCEMKSSVRNWNTKSKKVFFFHGFHSLPVEFIFTIWNYFSEMIEKELAVLRQNKVADVSFSSILCCFEEISQNGIQFDVNRVQFTGN